MEFYKLKIKNKYLYLLLLFVLIVFLFFFISTVFVKEKSDKDYPHVIINEEKINVEVADTFEERRQGLSDREFLEKETGMLFIFDDKQVRSFWMKRMNFSIDIIWIEDGVIVGIDKNLPPEGEKPQFKYRSPVGVNYVLEVNAGYTNKNEIKVGDQVNYNLN